jgi:hypothetical protein
MPLSTKTWAATFTFQELIQANSRLPYPRSKTSQDCSVQWLEILRTEGIELWTLKIIITLKWQADSKLQQCPVAIGSGCLARLTLVLTIHFSYQLIWVLDEEQLGGQMYVALPSGNTNRIFFDDVQGNPPVRLEEFPVGAVNLDTRSTPVMASIYTEEDQVLQLGSGIITDCGPFDPTGLPEQVVVGATNTTGDIQYWIHTPTFKLLQNDLTQPLHDGGKAAVDVTKKGTYDRYEALCSTVERTFLNEDTCFLSDTACASTALVDDVAVPLTVTNFEVIFNATGGGGNGTDTRYVYRIENLKQDSSYVDYPCEDGARSRWVKTDNCTDYVMVDQATSDVFSYLISQRSSTDPNLYIRDVLMPNTNINGLECHPDDVSKFDFKVLVGGDCWENTHPDNYQVYDMTYWTTNHNGNRQLDNFYPIYRPATLYGTFVLRYPNSHRDVMFRWHANKANFINVGRYGDTVNLREMPAELQRDEIAAEFCNGEYLCGLNKEAPKGPFLVCGSSFEVANDHSEDAGTIGRGGFDMTTQYNSTTSQENLFDQLETTWLEIAMYAPDQLRQRVAWALSQILVISPGGIGDDDLGENWVNYYDIFVRHAFGNYFDILKEVTYSPMMSSMLTYVYGRSTGYNFGRDGTISYADENYAREIMQLFSIGLYALNNDGTRIVEEEKFVRAYTNQDITEYARVYTGFQRKLGRGNIETDVPYARWRQNYIDPMDIRVEYRDHLPKASRVRKLTTFFTILRLICFLSLCSLAWISNTSAMAIHCAMTCLQDTF